MERIIRKRILGLLIIVFAFMLFAPRDVFASEKCDAAKTKFENEAAFDTYEISFSYIRSGDKFKISMAESVKDSKVLTDAKITNPKLKITKLVVKDGNGNVTTTITDADKIKEKLGGTSLTPGASLDVKRTAFGWNFKNGTLEVTLEPDGFMDPNLKAACGDSAYFWMIASASINIGDNMKPISLNFGGTPIISTKYQKTDCVDYAKKYDSKSFEYSYCRDLEAAEAAGAKEYNFNEKTSKYTESAVDLKCDYKIKNPNDINVSIFLEDGKTPNPNYYKNTTYLIGHGKEEKKAGSYVFNVEVGKQSSVDATCEVECDEVVTVEYGAPIATTAGFCIEYKVRVTSRVSCGMTKEPSKPPEAVVCTPTPVCVHSNQAVYTQGGPSQDFDKCIEKCDGGKYTDKCSSKCYKQVYGKSTSITKMGTVNGYEISYALRVSRMNEYDPPYYTSKASANQCIYKVNSNGSIVWLTDNDDDKRYKDDGHVTTCDSTWHLNNDWGFSTSDYTITKDGIPATEVCGDDCYWEENDSDECQNAEYVYLNDPDTYNKYHKDTPETDKNGNVKKDKDGNVVYLKSQYEKDMEANRKTYETLRDKCIASVTCNTTTAEFTISVDYMQNDGKKVTINYPFTTDKKDKIKYENKDLTTCTTDKGFTTILSSAGCYNCNKATAQNMYQTEWSFPGVWVHQKYRTVEYDGSKIDTTKWELWPYQFCLPLNTASVNSKWYNYYQALKNGDNTSLSYNSEDHKIISCADGTKKTCGATCDYKNTTYTAQDAKSKYDNTDPGITDYNIRASAKNFGFFEWDIDISCFYAVNNTFPCVDKDSGGKGDNDSCSCDSTTTANKGLDSAYNIRSIDLENVFPDSEGNKLTSASSTGRTPGFNWSEFASQEIKDPNYKSLPAKYTSWIQAKGYSVYSDEYLDYEVDLTKEMITKIKKSNVNYTNWQGIVNQPGKEEMKSASTYQSKLIREELAGYTKYPNYKTLQCNNIGKHNSISANYDANCEDFTGEVE